ncbi:EREBP-4 family protein [Besnoitia besnoiti]|uniref:EREBP-4 family protein n=1 Tax=Besnoitia besnoiti TaxID=94643 RepID=A0A2A9M6R7_BESBE|nr:EREBP-4 family protein [Besnoitia besnoiti]PFH33649.1 EREBP-4 family protein [Besnoitia besnoiti]
MPSIRLNVYRIGGKFAPPALCGCCAVYHTGVQIGAREYSFAHGAGVVAAEFDPSRAGSARLSVFGGAAGADEELEDAEFVYSLNMGECAMTGGQIAAAIETLSRDFAGEHYHLLERNCNHFSDALCRRLVGRGIPAYINRAAWLGRWISCLFPRGVFVGPLPETVSEASPCTGLFEGAGQRLGADPRYACAPPLLDAPRSPNEAQTLSGVLRGFSQQWADAGPVYSVNQYSSTTTVIAADEASALELSRALLADAAKARIERQKGR